MQGIQMTRNIREGQVLGANQLHRWTPEHAIVLLTYESCILDSLGRNIVYVGIRTNNPDIVRVRLEGVECNVCSPYQYDPLLQQTHRRVQRGPTLTNQEAYPNTGHVKPIQKPLDVVSDQLALIRLFPLEDTPRDGRNGRVVSPLDIV